MLCAHGEEATRALSEGDIMASFEACAGSGRQAVDLNQCPSVADGFGMTRAKTFGHCPVCGYTKRAYGITSSIKMPRHKSKAEEV